jgi:hypothetical protein
MRIDQAELKYVNAWLRSQNYPPFDASHSGGEIGLSVMFRKLGEPGDIVHINNHIAVWLTSYPWERAPFGNNCHCEVILEIAPRFVVRLGTMYLREMDDPETPGKKLYTPGSSFVHRIDNYEHYDRILFHSDRAAHLRALRVAIQNLGMPFNVPGYKLLAFSPHTVGTPAYCPVAHASLRQTSPPIGSAHCTQLVILLLQAARHSLEQSGIVYDADHWTHCAHSMYAQNAHPNKVFRNMYGALGTKYFKGIRSSSQKISL